ncbi:phage portal protein [Amycolatopsis sp. NPDC059027]|uniref:phage portal protein n=1 Tax=Amycolatopsis sp. NPDC059027 TaxID=3346709 RepID=UPI00366C0E25
MALTPETLRKLIDEHTGDITEELSRLNRIQCYVNGTHDKPYVPREATEQYKKLVDRSVTNLMPMVRNAPLQQLFVDGVRSDRNTGKPVPAWDIWQANHFDLRQTQIISAALTDGYAYGLTLPGETKDGKNVPVMRGVAARRMYALWKDPVSDLWPEYTFTLSTSGQIDGIYDNEAFYPVTVFPSQTNSGTGESYTPPPALGAPEFHYAGVCPVVRYAPDMDLDGNCYGEIEPNIPIQNRINQVSFDLLRVQHYGAFQVRGFSGVSVAKDANGRPKPIVMDPAITNVLTDPDSKPWQLSGDPLDGYILAFETAVHHLAVASQTPAHYLLGKLANLSADAIAAAETTLTRKVTGYKQTLGEAFEQQLRLASKLAGLDFPETAEVQWADRESRSLAQVADAIQKLASTGVPKQALWAMLPNVTQTQIEEWTELAAQQQADVIDGLAETLVNGRPAADPNAQ